MQEKKTNYEIIEDGQVLQLTKEQMQEKYQQHVKEAEQLINQTGYHRRDEELAELKAKTPTESGK